MLHAAEGKEAFERSVEADIAIAEAEQTEDVKAARNLYAYARELVPDDADVWFASARFEEAQNNQDLALQHLNRAVQLNPAHPLAPYERALLLYTMKRATEAKMAFEGYLEKNPIDLRAAHYLGLIALESDDYPTAKARFDAARKGDDVTAAYAAAYHAIVAAQLDDPQAGSYAKEALPIAPTPELKAKLQPLAGLATSGGESSAGADRYMPWFNVRLDFATEYDTNVSIGAASAAGLNSTVLQNAPDPNDPDVQAQLLPEPRSGFRFVENLRATFRPVASEKFTLEIEGEFLNANHDRASLRGFDFGGPAARVGFFSGFGDKVKLEFGVDANYRGTWTAAFRTHLIESIGGAPFVGVSFWPRHSLYLVGNVEFRSFIDPRLSPPTTANDRDGMIYSGGLYYSVPFWWFDASASAAYDNEHTTGKNFRLHGARASAILRFRYKELLSIGAVGSLNFRFYSQATPIRAEQRYEVALNVRYNIVRYFGIQASYTYTHNDAFQNGDRTPYDLYTYRRHVVGLTLIGQY
ncbi:MAG: hypothetical protein IT381_26885 [Deltaproteobacteria bacterium]|nr:hypothetical protein [Deltaproteobacteria bacterium]